MTVNTAVPAAALLSQEGINGDNKSSSAASGQAALSQTSSATQGGSTSAVPSTQDTKDAVQRINAHLAGSGQVIDLKVDPETHLTVTTVRDTSTGAVLQQFPAQDSLRLAQMLAGWSRGGSITLDLIA